MDLKSIGSFLKFIVFVTSFLMLASCGKDRQTVETPQPTAEPTPPLTLTLGLPTSDPVLIPPSTSPTAVKFLSAASGTFYPDQLMLQEVVSENDHTVILNVVELRDDGTGGDDVRGDRIFTGVVELGDVSSIEKFYRVSGELDGAGIASAVGSFWISGCPATSRPSNPDLLVLDDVTGANIYANEVLITLDESISPELSDINAIVAGEGGYVVGCVPSLRQYLIEIPSSTTATQIRDVINRLSAQTNVVSAAPNAEVMALQVEEAPDCDGEECHWYMERIRSNYAWNITNGGDEQYSTAVLDFGVDCDHSELECAVNELDSDVIDHGTGVAGVIGARAGDGSELVGVAWDTDIYPYNISGGLHSVSEAIMQSLTQPNVKVINISATTNADDGSIQRAICTAIGSGRLVVVAAGNAAASQNCESDNWYPERYNSIGQCDNGADISRGMIVVGATDGNNNLHTWRDGRVCSNTAHTDIYAPGVSIFTASNDGGYTTKSGSSFAAPLVAGTASLLWSTHPELTVEEVHDQIIESSGLLGIGETGRNFSNDILMQGKMALDTFASVGGSDEVPDIDPDPIVFNSVSGVQRDAWISSGAIEVTGIDSAAPIDVIGGFYSIDGGAFTSASGVVEEGQSVIVQLKSAISFSTPSQVDLTIGSVSAAFQVTTEARDTQPDNFDFLDVTEAALGAEIISESLGIPGINSGTSISVSGGEYSIDGGAFTSVDGTVNPDQSIRLRVVASSSPETTEIAVVSIGGVNDRFNVTTLDADRSPESFSLSDITGVSPSTLVVSNTVVINGINTATAISVSGGEFSLDGGAFRRNASTINNGQSVTVRHVSSSNFASDTYTTLTVGNFNATFRSTTEVNTAPQATALSISGGSAQGPFVGDVLTGQYQYTDAENDVEGLSQFRWLRNGSAINGATTASYQLTQSDSEEQITFEVTPVALTGDLIGITQTADVTVQNAVPSLSNVTIVDETGGEIAVGDALSVSYTYLDVDGDAEGTSTYQWMRNDFAIAGAINSAYVLTDLDAAQEISVSVTPVSLTGNSPGLAVESDRVVTGNVPPVASSVVVENSLGNLATLVNVGEVIDGVYIYSDVDGDIEGQTLFQWYSDGIPISGATSETYTVVDRDVGQTLTFEVIPVALTGSGAGQAVLSAGIGVNNPPEAENVGIINEIGVTTVGTTLTGEYTYADAEGDLESGTTFQWFRNGIAIVGATSITYEAVVADSGQDILFEVLPLAATGSIQGTGVRSGSIRVENSAPTASSVSISGDAITGGTLMGAYAFNDLDGDLEGATTFRWINDTTVLGTAQNYTIADGVSGEIVFEVTPRSSTGEVLGSPVTSSSVTVTAVDTTPDVFVFTDVADTDFSVQLTSNAITVSGITGPTSIAIISIQDEALAEYSVNGDAFTAVAGTVNDGDSVEVRMTTGADLGVTHTASLTIGGVSETFFSTTRTTNVPPAWDNAPQAPKENFVTDLARGLQHFSGIDIDGDGDTDLILASNEDSSFSWFDNSFDASGNLQFDRQYLDRYDVDLTSTAAGDIDGDGDVDLLLATHGPEAVNLYLNQGGGGFVKAQVAAFAGGADDIHLADINSDGDMDIVAVGEQVGSIFWYENDGNSPPNFTEHTIASITGIVSVFVNDMNNDGTLDILYASTSNNTIGWYINDGATQPNFIDEEVDINANDVFSIVSADMNGDGWQDIVTSMGGSMNQVFVYESDGAVLPGFVARVVDTITGLPSQANIADVDGDGDFDILAGPYDFGGGEEVSWYENDGTSSPAFVKHGLSGATRGIKNIIAEDLNGDGDVEIIAGSETLDKITWYDTSHIRSVALESSAQSIPNPASDTDGDTVRFNLGNTLDESSFVMDGVVPGEISFTAPLFANPQDSNSDRVYKAVLEASDGAAVMRRKVTVTVYENDLDDDNDGVDDLSDVFPLDPDEQMNTDGDALGNNADTDDDEDGVLDINDSAPLDVANNTVPQWDSAADSAIQNIISSSAGGAFDVEIADLDGDGDLDAVAVLFDAGRIEWYENDGASVPGFAVNTLADHFNVRSVSVGDIDGDTNLDVVIGAEGENPVAWYRNNGAADPTFALNPIAGAGPGSFDVLVADLDQDGDRDVIVATGTDGNALEFYENDGAVVPNFTRTTIATDLSGAASLSVVDINGDANLDVVVAARDNDLITWYQNRLPGNPQFVQHRVSGFTNAEGVLSIATGDMDGDGDADIVSTGTNGMVMYYENLIVAGNPIPIGQAFSEHIVTSSADTGTVAKVADTDADGDLDILVASDASIDRIALFENDGTSNVNFVERTITTSLSNPSGVAVGDLNGDGFMELVSTDQLLDTVAWYPLVQRSVTVSEGSPISIIESATDSDGNSVSYVFAGEDVGVFSVNTLSGEVSLASAPSFNAPIDADSDNVYEVTVTATDGHSSIERKVLITIIP